MSVAEVLPVDFTGRDYTFNHQLSEKVDGTSKVYDISYKGRRYALKKVVAKTSRDLRVIQRERDVLVHLTSCLSAKERRRIDSHAHRFIVWLQRAVQTSPIDFHFIFTLAVGGDLFEQRLLRPNQTFSEADARFYLAELSCALRFLHVTCGVIHRDIKAENVLLDHSGHTLLGDFNLARRIQDNEPIRDESCGTLETVAPEAVPPMGEVSFASDIYSLGMLGLELVLGAARKIPSDLPEEKIFQMIASGERETTEGRTSEQFTRFINHLLAVRPSSRPSASHLRSMPFFEAVNGWRAIDWDKLLRRKLVPPKLIPREAPLNQPCGDVLAPAIWQTETLDKGDDFKGKILPGFHFELQEGN